MYIKKWHNTVNRFIKFKNNEKNMNYSSSFSIPPTQPENIKQVELLKAHAEKTGITFSHLVVKGILMLNKELGLTNEPETSDDSKK